MRFRVVQTHLRGVPRSKREIARSSGMVGDLITAAWEDEFLRGTVLVATLVGVEGGYQTSDLMPPLRDVTLRLIAPQGMMLIGHEREALGDGQYVEFVQGWWVRPCDRIGDAPANDSPASRPSRR